MCAGSGSSRLPVLVKDETDSSAAVIKMLSQCGGTPKRFRRLLECTLNQSALCCDFSVCIVTVTYWTIDVGCLAPVFFSWVHRLLDMINNVDYYKTQLRQSTCQHSVRVNDPRNLQRLFGFNLHAHDCLCLKLSNCLFMATYHLHRTCSIS